MIWNNEKRFKILLGGYINVNVIDGSAFFLSGFAGMCAQHPNVDIDLVTANRVKSWEVLDELVEYPNVQIIDPYRANAGHPELLERAHMTRAEYSVVLADEYARRTYDAIVIRDNEVAVNLLRKVPEARGRTFAYVTGLTFMGQEQDPFQINLLSEILELGGKLLCQTVEIKRLVQESLTVAAEDILLLPPHVPDPEPQALSALYKVEEPHRLVYTGKFFKDWKIDAILAGVKSANLDGAGLLLEVAGDQFRHSKEDGSFVENVGYLLKTTDGVKWHGRVPRNISRALISKSHVGIGWRSDKLEKSSELSTKILEYGALGRPSIINRTKMHERLLGKDYPLFVNSMSDFRSLLLRLRWSRDEIQVAAQRCYDLAHDHSYTKVSHEILPALGNRPSPAADFSLVHDDKLRDQLPPELLQRRAQVTSNGIWAQFTFDELSGIPIEQLASETARDFTSWRRTIDVTRRRIEASDRAHGLTTGSGFPPGNISDNEESKALRISLGRARNECQKLEVSLTDSRKKLTQALEREEYWRDYAATQTARLEALRTSKLGRIQTRMWKMRE